jgi:putative transposase
VLEIGDRRSLLYLHVLGVTADPDGPWTTQQARDLMVADLSEHAGWYRFVVRSQAGQFAARSTRCWPMRESKLSRSLRAAPRVNFCAERLVLTIRTELHAAERLAAVLRQTAVHPELVHR